MKAESSEVGFVCERQRKKGPCERYAHRGLRKEATSGVEPL